MSAERQTAIQTEPEDTGSICNTQNDVMQHIEYALQPLTDIGTGVVYGYEAQIRGWDAAGFSSPMDMLDDAHAKGELPQLEADLFTKAIELFSSLRIAQGTKLYFKLDGRDLGEKDDPRMNMGDIAARARLEVNQICLELSEHHKQTFTDVTHHALNDLRQLGILVAIDDFGRGSSELRLLHDMSPDYVKIDRFFLNGIDFDARRKLFVTSVANLSHVLGARVIAEGVETEQELEACRDAGCDLIQGYYVARPFKKAAEAKLFYDHVRAPAMGNKRKEEQERIKSELLRLPTIRFTTPLKEVMDMVIQNQDASVIPVVDASGEPRGLIHEKDLKAYIYAAGREGEEIDEALDFPLRSFIRACPIADIDSNSDMLLVSFASSINSDGIIITENFRYTGFLSATSLVKIIHEKRLQEAQDQNPLTRLPGNGAVTKYIADASQKEICNRHLCYIDFDNFKPFNDTYGYRQGDRSIILFSELLQRHVNGPGTFYGHVGGDDFFAGFHDADQTDVAAHMLSLKQAFRTDVESFYEPKHREQGFIEAQDRFGTMRKFPLLQCSVSVLTIEKGVKIKPQVLNQEISEMKHAAKKSEDGFAVKTISE